MLNFIAVFLVIIVVILLIIIGTGVRLVNQTDAYVIERLGKYRTTWEKGIHFRVPGIDKIVLKTTLKEQVADFEPQDVITKDNVVMKIDAVVFFQITDPKLYIYGNANPMMAIKSIAMTTLRNVIGDLHLDETLTSRDQINERLRSVLDAATDPWGIKVSRVEVKNILPPDTIKEAMEKQMRAERQRREQILIAEGEKTSEILKAEGYKESTILRAEAESQEIRLRNAAIAEGIKILNDAQPSKEALTIEALKTLKEVANGQATKIVIPTELTGIAALGSILGETQK